VADDSSALRDADAEKSAVPVPGVQEPDVSSSPAQSLASLLQGLAALLASTEPYKPDADRSGARSFAAALELMALGLLIQLFLTFLPMLMETRMSKRVERHSVAAGLEAQPDAALKPPASSVMVRRAKPLAVSGLLEALAPPEPQPAAEREVQER